MARNPLAKSVAVVAAFWWIALTIWAVGADPLAALASFEDIPILIREWGICALAGVAFGAWLIWFERICALNRIYRGNHGMSVNGMVSTLGAVPMLAPAPPRTTVSRERLPIESDTVQAWLREAEARHPQHYALFFAIWDTYSTHREWPASHREGGHAGRMLYEHCLAVAENAIGQAPNWQYDGVFVKKAGLPRVQIVKKRNADYTFDPSDPLIVLVALAHDIGKIEAYRKGIDGSFTTEEPNTATQQDDRRVHHDQLGSRILARLPEFWALPSRDRRAMAMVIAHYHHPSALPVDDKLQAFDDRTCALMEFLIYVDRQTGIQESALGSSSSSMGDADRDAAAIYEAFGEILAQPGRIATGTTSGPGPRRIGLKVSGLLVIHELELRKLLLAHLGWTLRAGELRYAVTNTLLEVLKNKGLAYVEHNGTSFGPIAPLFAVAIRNSSTGAHMFSWNPAIIVTPSSGVTELSQMFDAPNFDAGVDIERPVFTHIDRCENPVELRRKVAAAFGDDVATAVALNGQRETQAERRARAGEAETARKVDDASTDHPHGPQTTVDALAAKEDQIVPDSNEGQEEGVRFSSEAGSAAVSLDEAAQLAPTPSTLCQDEQIDPNEFPPIDTYHSEPGIDDADEDVPWSQDATGSDATAGHDDFSDFPDVPVFVSERPPEEAQKVELSAATSVDEPRHLIDRIGDDEALIPHVDGVAIPDSGGPRRKRRQSDSDKAAALEQLGLLDAGATIQIYGQKRPPRSKPKRPTFNITVETLRELVVDGTLPTAGTLDGKTYHLAADVLMVAPGTDLAAFAIAHSLPYINAGEGQFLVGLPQ